MTEPAPCVINRIPSSIAFLNNSGSFSAHSIVHRNNFYLTVNTTIIIYYRCKWVTISIVSFPTAAYGPDKGSIAAILIGALVSFFSQAIKKITLSIVIKKFLNYSLKASIFMHFYIKFFFINIYYLPCTCRRKTSCFSIYISTFTKLVFNILFYLTTSF